MAAVAAVATLLVACPAPPKFNGRVYRDKGVSFTVPSVPSGWRPIDVADADLAFRDDARAASILVNSKCKRKDDDVPLVSLTDHLIMGTTDREFLEQKTIPFDNREAMHTILRAKLDGVPMQYDIFVAKKNGCVFDFVYVAEPATFAEGSAEFERFVQGVHVVDTPDPAEP